MSKEEKFVEAQYRGRGTVFDWAKGFILHPVAIVMIGIPALLIVAILGYNDLKEGLNGDARAFVKPINNDRNSMDSSNYRSYPLPEKVDCPPPQIVEKIVYKDRVVKVPKIVSVEKIVKIPVEKIIYRDKIKKVLVPLSCETPLLEARSICQGQLKLLSKTCHDNLNQVLDARKPRRRPTRRVKDHGLIALACNYGLSWNFSSQRRSLLKKHCNRSGH